MEIRKQSSYTIASSLRFDRFEFKYLLPTQRRNALERDLLHFLEFDPFVRNRPDNKYFVRSLYYDDPSYTCFHDKIDGLHSRSKFRLRTYTRNPLEDVPLFLEIKGRYNNLVYKNRTYVHRGDVDWGTLAGKALSKALLDKAGGGKVHDNFHYQLLRKRLRPVALIDYERRPYLSKYDPNFRITFDEELMATRTDRLFPDGTASPRKVLAGYTVIEIKFRRHIPSWFHWAIKTHELRRVSVSKICYGMETLEIANDEA